MKYLFTLLLSLTLMFVSHSQTREGWEIGLEAGFNASTITGTYSNNDNSKHKWIGTPAVGLKAFYNFNTLIAVGTGLYLMKSGLLLTYNNSSGGESFNYKQRERFTSLRIPVFARFAWGTTWQYYALAGIYISKKLCGRYVYNDLNSGYEESGKIKFQKNPENTYQDGDLYLDTELYRRLAIGLMVGAGIRTLLGPGFIGLNLTYGYGLCDFNKWENKSDRPDGHRPYRDMNVAIMVTYVVMVSTLINAVSR